MKSGTITYTSIAPAEGSYDVVNDGSAPPVSGYSTVMKSAHNGHHAARQPQQIVQRSPGKSASVYGQTMPMKGRKPGAIGIEQSYATAPVAEAGWKPIRPIHAIVTKPIYDLTVWGDVQPLSAKMIARVSSWLSSGSTPEEAEAALRVCAHHLAQSKIPLRRLMLACTSHSPGLY